MSENLIKSEPFNFNVGIQKWYEKELITLVKNMTEECLKEIKKLYKAQKEQITFDESISSQLRILLNQLQKKWDKKTAEKADELSKKLTKKTNKFTSFLVLTALTGMFGKTLENGKPYTPKLTSPELDEVIKALIYENVSLIKSIPSKYFTDITGVVYRGVEAGKGVSFIEEQLIKHYGVAKRRAKIISLDQTRKAQNSMNLRKMQVNGVRKFEWLHSGGSQQPRKYHMAKYPTGLNGGIFEIDKPPVIDKKTGERGYPSQLVNCLTGKMKLISPYLHDRIFRRKFTGELVTLVTGMGNIELTPNHPILTDKGWVAAGRLDVGDNIAKISDETFFTCSTQPYNTETTIEQFFGFYSILFNPTRISNADFNFHGDVAIDNEVDIINIELKLANHIKTEFNKSRFEHIFSEAHKIFNSNTGSGCFYKAFPFGRFIANGFISSLDKAFSFFFGSESHTVESTFRAVAWLDTLLDEVVGYTTTRNPEFFRKLFDAHTFDEKFFQLIIWELTYIWLNLHPYSFKGNRDIMGITSLNLPDFAKRKSALIQFDTIINKNICKNFTGHVYNLQNSNNWYLTENYITKNCKCRMVMVSEV